MARPRVASRPLAAGSAAVVLAVLALLLPDESLISILAGVLALAAAAAAVVLAYRAGRFGTSTGRFVLGAVLLVGTVLVGVLGGGRTVRFVEYHQPLAVVGSFVVVAYTLLLPALLILRPDVTPAAAPGTEPGSTERSPSTS